MNNRITEALVRCFERHRIVFWYDSKQELRADFEALTLPDVEKIEILNNEYGIKYRILREQPEKKFLLYRDGPQPDDLDNWLLDVQLAEGEFRTDQVSIWLSELELGLEFADVIENHTEFYQNAKRKEALQKLLKPDDTRGRLRLKLLAVCAGSEPRIDSVAEHLLSELAHDKDDRMKLIGHCRLDGFLWEQLDRAYGYQSETPGIRDFVIALFKSAYAMGTDGEVRLNSDALVFLKRWKDSRQFETAFEKLSGECAGVLGIEQDLSRRDFRDLIDLDYFQLIDRKIISDLVRAVTDRTVAAGDVAQWLRQRRQSHWYGEFKHFYLAIQNAAEFSQLLPQATLTMETLTHGVECYAKSWFRLDQLYRKFTYHVLASGQVSLMDTMSEQIENYYANNYLPGLNNNWQTLVDRADRWDATAVLLQRQFFERCVSPFLKKDNKVCVVISDALRYEIGDELLRRIRQEDGYTAEIEPALAMLPSYTQLGMAALLPHQELKIAEDDTGTVLVNGQSSQGTANRAKILSAARDGRATAVPYDKLMGMNRDDSRELLKANDVLYVYHNRIDHTGDKMLSEGHVFEAVEETLHDLVQIVKKLTAANASNILITADHGFIYQNRPIEESDFSKSDVEGDQIFYRDRRFVLGKGLKNISSLTKFKSAQLGLAGEMEVLLPKSVNRLPLKGSGSRFVHGGASLQEVVIPVLKINKKRQSDISQVEVEIWKGASSLISSGQLAITLYQTEAVTDKVQSRTLRVGIYSQTGDLISDSHELTFDLDSPNPRERELQVRLVLTHKADEVNNQEVVLRLEERHAGTSHYKEYKSLRYIMRRSFTSDFDF